jgi:predicted XRE-type DNA-binding protein
MRIDVGSENIFADIGLPNPEEHLLKAQLMVAIIDQVRRRKLTQKRAAAIVGLKQPELSRITGGRPNGFSADRLIQVLRRLGVDIQITMRPNPRRAGRVSVKSIGLRPRASKRA